MFDSTGEMETAALAIIILGIFSGLSSGVGVLPDTLSAAVGGTLNFTTTLSQTEEPYISINWKFDDRNIITSDVASNDTDQGYRDRITLFPSTGSLELRNLVSGDSGEYRVFIVPNGEPVTVGSTRLQVYVPVSNVQITSPGTDLVEFKNEVSLSCSSGGTSLFYFWWNDTSRVTAGDRVKLTNEGKTFTITNVTRYDQGPFVCMASNTLGFETSGPANLSVSFGPENTNLRRSPSQEYFNEGSNISLLCSADSRPAAMFNWFFNGEKLLDTGPELRLTNINTNHSGNYSCLASNTKTLLNDMSQSLPVTVLERISDVSVISSSNQTLEGNSVNLTCDAAGSVFTRVWMKDGSNFTLADNIKLYNDDRVLSFQPLTKNERGEYSCNVSNPLTNKEARHILIVNYGPEDVQIKGQSQVNLGQTFTLTCSAGSVPHADYTWIWNGTEIYYLSEYIHNNTELSSSGNYTCEARNRITERKSSAVHELTVTENKGLSVGAIAGIVIACVAVVSLAVGGFFIYRKFSSKPEPNNQSNNTSNVQLQPQPQPTAQDEHIYEELSVYENA